MRGMQVSDMMTPNPVCCTPEATIQEIARKMDEIDTGIIPLVDQGQLRGVITDRDIAIRAVADGADPKQAKAIDYATKDVKCVSPSDDVEEAVELMEEAMIRRLVVTENGRVVGMLSLGDMAETNSEDAEDVLVEVSKSPKTLAHRKQMER